VASTVIGNPSSLLTLKAAEITEAEITEADDRQEATAEQEIGEENFPDAIFREYIETKFDRDDNGVLSVIELEEVTDISVVGRGINDLKGIELFPNVESLSCEQNNLTSLDVSNNLALAELYCYDNELMNLDVSNNPALEVIECRNNNLTSLDVSNTPILKTLSCEINKLMYLNVSNNPRLRFLYCESNNLASLDVSNNPLLTELYCNGNSYTTNSASIDTTTIEGFEISKASDWINANVNGTEVFFIDDTKEITYTYEIGGGRTEKFSFVFYSEADPEPDKEPDTETVEINETNFPDEAFRQYVKENFDEDDNGAFSSDEQYAVNVIDVEGKNISSLKGIEFFANLTSLSCPANNLTSLNVSQNPALKSLVCYGNALTSLDVSENPDLEVLYCEWNPLIGLDVSHNPILKELICGGSDTLTSLNVSQNPALEYLFCESNALTSLDLSQNPVLKYLFCGGNELTGLDVSNNPELIWLWSINCGLKSLDVSQNPALEWLWCSDNKLSSLDTSKNPVLERVDCDNNELTSLDVSNNPALTSLICYANKLTSLDVSNNPALEWLNCRNNKLISLDVSQNLELQWLYCSNNELMSLDINQNPVLENVDCSDNTYIMNSKSIDVSTMIGFDMNKSSNWENATISGNLITIIDPSLKIKYDYQIQEEKTCEFSLILNQPDEAGFIEVTPPTELAASLKDTASITLNWKASDEAEGYEIYYSTKENGSYKKVSETTGTSYTHENLTMGQTYYYRVFAYKVVDGTTYYSTHTEEVSCNIPVIKPTGLTASVVGASSIKLSWKKATDADGYRVLVSTKRDDGYTELGHTTNNSYTCKNLNAGTTYYFKICSYKTVSGTKVYSSDTSAISKKLTVPIPTNIKLTNSSANSLKVSWSKVSEASGYELYRATSKSGTYKKIKTVTSGTTTSYTDKSLTNGKTYYYKVRAYKTVSGSKKYSSYCSIISKKVTLAKTTLTATTKSKTSVKLSWVKVPGAKQYEIYRATSKNGSYKKIKTTISLTYTDTKLKSNKIYYYKVKAVQVVSKKTYMSAYSAVQSAKTKK